MSVIGRLDDQVDEVLIKPLSKNRSEKNEPQDGDSALNPETEPVSERVRERKESEALPVWLL